MRQIPCQKCWRYKCICSKKPAPPLTASPLDSIGPARARHTDPIHVHDAAAYINRRKRSGQVLHIINARGPSSTADMADDSERILGEFVPENYVSSLCGDLFSIGILSRVKTTNRRSADKNEPSTRYVYDIAPLGRIALEEAKKIPPKRRKEKAPPQDITIVNTSIH